jgi:hypothetical protein
LPPNWIEFFDDSRRPEVFCTTAMPNSQHNDMAMNRTLRIWMTVSAAQLATLALSACTSETASRFLVEPDRFVLYGCNDLAAQAQLNLTRQRELELLIAKAGSGVASAMAYQPEYLQLRGEMTQLRKAAADKNCKPLPSAPAPVPTAGGRNSDQAVR